jgi:Predicted nucleic acid-binding protein, contains PIN domain
VDEKVALRCAGLHVPDRRPFLDSLVAATALAHDLTPVTRHVRDFEGTGGKLIDPWKPNC